MIIPVEILFVYRYLPIDEEAGIPLSPLCLSGEYVDAFTKAYTETSKAKVSNANEQ